MFFSLVNENHTNFKNMIKNSKTTGTPFSYYSIKKKQFLNKDKSPINSIFEMVSNSYKIKPIFCLGKEYFDFRIHIFSDKQPNFKINKQIKEQIISILNLVYYKDIIDIEFQESLSKRFINSVSYDLYYTQDKNETFILINKNEKYIVYSLSEVDLKEAKNYLLGNESEYDCFLYSF